MRRHLLLPALSASRRSSWCQTCPRRFPGRFSGTCNIVLRTATQSKAGGRSPLRWALSGDEVGPALRLRLWARSSHVSAFSSWQPLASVSWVQICPSAHPASSPRAHATSLSVFKPELLSEILSKVREVTQPFQDTLMVRGVKARNRPRGLQSRSALPACAWPCPRSLGVPWVQADPLGTARPPPPPPGPPGLLPGTFGSSSRERRTPSGPACRCRPTAFG